MKPEMIVGLFDDYDEAQAAVNALLADGFDRDAINLLANNTMERFAAGCSAGQIPGATGHAATTGCGMLEGVGPLLAVGPLAAAVAGTNWGLSAGNNGSAQSGLTGLGIGANESAYYTDGLRDGGTLMAVRAETEPCAREARMVLSQYGATIAPTSTGSRRVGMRDASTLIQDPDVYADEDSLFTDDAPAETGIRAYAARL